MANLKNNIIIRLLNTRKSMHGMLKEMEFYFKRRKKECLASLLHCIHFFFRRIRMGGKSKEIKSFFTTQLNHFKMLLKEALPSCWTYFSICVCTPSLWKILKQVQDNVWVPGLWIYCMFLNFKKYCVMIFKKCTVKKRRVMEL